MADFGTPAQANYNPPDALQTIGDFMSLKARKQALDSGALDIARKQAELPGQAAVAQGQVQAQQQNAAEAKYFNNFNLAKHQSDDGTVDINSAVSDPGFKELGTNAPGVLQKLAQIKNTQLEGKQALANLNAGLRNQFYTGIGALRTDKDVQEGNETGKGKVLDAIQAFAQQSPDAARVAQLFSAPIQNGKPKQLKDVLQSYQLMAQSAGEAMKTTAPGGAMVQGDNSQYVANTNSYAPQGVGSSVGKPMRQGIGPTDQPGYRRAVAAAGTEGTAGAGNDEELYNAVTQAGTKAPQIKSLTKTISSLADEVTSGKFSKGSAEYLSALQTRLGYKDGQTLNADDKRILLGKYVQQLAIQQEQANGANSDAARASVEAALPNPESMSPAALKAAAEYVGGQADITAARSKVAQNFRAKQGSATGLRSVDSHFMENANDPRIFVYKGKQAGEQKQNYLKDNFRSKADLQEFLQRKAAAEYHE